MGFLDELLSPDQDQPAQDPSGRHQPAPHHKGPQHQGPQQHGRSKRSDYQQFTERYEHGDPADGYDDDEVAHRYDEVSRNIDRSTYQASAQQALARLKPAQRRQFGQRLQQQARQHGHDVDYDGQSDDPGVLAGLTTQLHDKDPGLLSQLMGAAGGAGGGSGAGGMVGSLISTATGGGGGSAGKGVMAGIVSFATKSLLNR